MEMDDDDNDDDSSSSSDSSDGDDDNMSIDDIVNEGINITHLYYYQINQPIEYPNIEWGRRVTIADWSDAECANNLRFRKDALQDLADRLWPRLLPYLGEGATRDRIVLERRYVAPYETLLMIYFYRLHYPSRYRPEMEVIFGMQSSHLSRAISHFSRALYQLAIRYLTDVSIWHAKMLHYAAKVYAKCKVLDCVWGFVDGTFRPICRPKMHQQQCYSGHKHAHGLKYQGVVTPDGFIACLHGPWPGCRHDATMLQESNMLEQLIELMPENEANGPVYSLYGDDAYPRSQHLLGGFRNPPANTPEAKFNQRMARSRMAVEWGFELVMSNWSYVNFKPLSRVYLSPCGRHYVNACFLTNLLNCMDGNKTANYFDCWPMSVEEYLSMID